MADVSVDGDVIYGQVEIAAPPDRVFRALTDPERLRSWWGSKETYWITAWRSDLRVGGRWDCEGISSSGRPFKVEGVFLEIEPPRRLVYSWQPSWHSIPPTTVTFDLMATGGGTMLRVRHEGFGGHRRAREDHGKGWPAILGWLCAYAERGESA